MAHPNRSRFLASLATARFRWLAVSGGAVALAALLAPAASHAQNLYVSNAGNNTVSEYNATVGGPAIPGFDPANVSGPNFLALSGNSLYVANGSANTVGEYNATTGAPITTFVNPVGSNEPNGLAILNVPELST